MSEEYILSISKSLMPIGLRILKGLYKHDLLTIILNREISFNKLREEYLDEVKSSFKDSFEFARINLGLSYTQEELVEKNLAMVKKLKKLKEVMLEEDYNE